MTDVVLTVGPNHTVGDVARQMAERNVGAAVVLDPDSPGPGIMTERDVLRAVAAQNDTVGIYARDFTSRDLILADPDWGLERAAETMLRNNFRHLLVVEDGRLVGIISMRDIVSSWVRAGVAAR